MLCCRSRIAARVVIASREPDSTNPNDLGHGFDLLTRSYATPGADPVLQAGSPSSVGTAPIRFRDGAMGFCCIGQPRSRPKSC